MPDEALLLATGQAFLFAGLLFMVRGLVEGKGTMSPGRDKRIALTLITLSIAVTLITVGLDRVEGN